MLEFKLTAVSQSEIIAGIVIDQGEYEKAPNSWIEFIRLRIGLIFLTLDFTWFYV